MSDYPRYMYRVGEGVSSGILVQSPTEVLPPGEWTDKPTVNDVDPFSPHYVAPKAKGADGDAAKDAYIKALEAKLESSGKDSRIAELEARLAAAEAKATAPADKEEPRKPTKAEPAAAKAAEAKAGDAA